MRLLVVTTLLLATGAVPAVACSPPAPNPSRPWAFNFLGRALTDSVLAGRGPVMPPGFLDRLRGRAVYGQRFAVERIGAPWQSQLPAGTRTVILVAWDIDPGNCERLYRTGSAVWMTPGMQAVHQAELRKKSQWINGEPTLDVVWSGLYAPDRRRPTSANSAIRWLTPADHLGLIESLPSYDSVENDPRVALAALDRWAKSHPALATAEPAHGLIELARNLVAWREERR